MTRGIITITKKGLDLYLPTLASVVHTDFPVTAVRDMDVLNDEQITGMIKAIFDTNKVITPLSFVIVLAEDALFVKDFPSPNPPPPPPAAQPGAQQSSQPKPAADPVTTKKILQEQDTQMKVFIEKVPFENVATILLPTPTGRKMIATNKDLFLSLKAALVSLHATVEAVVPVIALRPGTVLSGGLNPQIAQNILVQNDLIHKYDMVREIVTQQQVEASVDPKTGKTKPSNMRAYILIGVFVVLVLFMIGLYYVMYIAPAKKTPEKPALPTPVAASPTSAITPSEVASSSAQISSLNVQIVSNAQTARSVAAVRSSMQSLGIRTITTSSTTSSTPRTFTLFSSDVPSSARTAIITELQKTYPTMTSQESATSTNTVVITLGNR